MSDRKVPLAADVMIRKKPEIISWEKVLAISAQYQVCKRAGLDHIVTPLLAELRWGVRQQMLTQCEYDLFQKMWQSTMR